MPHAVSRGPIQLEELSSTESGAGKTFGGDFFWRGDSSKLAFALLRKASLGSSGGLLVHVEPCSLA